MVNAIRFFSGREVSQMRLDVFAVLLIVVLVIADYALTGGFYTGKVMELGQRVYWGISQRF
jgi:hypothetical protein